MTHQRTRLDADQSADLLRLLLVNQQRFFFARYGDGFLECVYQLRQGGATCDGEMYSTDLALAINEAWGRLQALHHDGMPLIVADWLSATFDELQTGMHPDHYLHMMDGVAESAIFVNYEALMFNRISSAIPKFYRAVKTDIRTKALIGPVAWAPAAEMLDAVHIPIPTSGLLGYVAGIERALKTIQPEVILFGAGMAGVVPVVSYVCEYPRTTAVNIGSSLDPLFRGRTRKGQLPGHLVREMFRREGMLT